MRASPQLGRATCGNEPVAPGADAAAGSASRVPGTLSAGTLAASRHRAHGGRFLPTLAGAFGLRPLSRALALLAALPLAACEADPIGARATLQEWGYSGIAIAAAPSFGRPCHWSEPFAVRWTAHDERGAPATRWLCAADEAAEDARILLDREGA